MRSVLIALLVSGCAVRFQTDPLGFEAGLLYSRITNCTAKDVPAPLIPQKDATRRPLPKIQMESGNDPKPGMTVEGQETHCNTLEVGAKSYADSISAIGGVLAAIIAKVVLF